MKALPCGPAIALTCQLPLRGVRLGPPLPREVPRALLPPPCHLPTGTPPSGRALRRTGGLVMSFTQGAGGHRSPLLGLSAADILFLLGPFLGRVLCCKRHCSRPVGGSSGSNHGGEGAAGLGRWEQALSTAGFRLQPDPPRKHRRGAGWLPLWGSRPRLCPKHPWVPQHPACMGSFTEAQILDPETLASQDLRGLERPKSTTTYPTRDCH